MKIYSGSYWLSELLFLTHKGDTPDIEDLKEISNLLSKNKAHFCPDWDHLLIDEHMCEFQGCTCYE